MLSVSAREAKQDTRLRDSGKLIKFRFYGKDYPNTPPTFFYDWLYINALIKNENLIKQVLKYDCFSDIEFNEKKSINYSKTLDFMMIIHHYKKYRYGVKHGR